MNNNNIDENRFTVQQADIFHDITTTFGDAILCNPPFHQQHSVSTHIAEGMIKQSHSRLNKGGSLYLVANRHLPYKAMLKRFFSQIEITATNDKFFIYHSIK